MITWECLLYMVILYRFRVVLFNGIRCEGSRSTCQEKKARILTARMNRAGIHSLEELKSRLDAHGEAKQRSLGKVTKEGLTVEDVLTFLDAWMCYEELLMFWVGTDHGLGT